MIRTNAFANKIIMILLALALVAGFGVLSGMASPAFAEDGESGEESSEQTVLNVYYDEHLLKSFSRSSLEALEKRDSNGAPLRYSFSGLNTNQFPSQLIFAETSNGDDGPDGPSLEGPTVEDILNKALQEPEADVESVTLPESINDLDKDSTIEVCESLRSTAYNAILTKEQLFADRYYYPNVGNEASRFGEPAQASSYEGREKVPAIISLSEDQDGRFFFGQIVPNEQNAPDWVQRVATYSPGFPDSVGRIVIHSEPAKQWNALEETSPEAGSEVFVRDSITFMRGTNVFNKGKGGYRYWIYYTVDGSEPTLESNQYNYNNNGHDEDDFSAKEWKNHPTITSPGEYTIKAKVIGNGRPDSEITTFRYIGVFPIDVTVQGKQERQTYCGTPYVHVPEIDWSATGSQLTGVSLKGQAAVQKEVTDAGIYPDGLNKDALEFSFSDDRYRVRKVEIEDGGITILPAALKVKTMSASKKYDGKALTAEGSIEGFVNDETADFRVIGQQTNVGKSQNKYTLGWTGTAKEENYTIEESLGVLRIDLPTVARPSLKTPVAKGRTITLKWKKVAGATGYKIYRSTKKKTGYKLVKTVKKGTITSWKNSKLKKKKTYYYKIRAYRTIPGKTVYSSYSAVKYKKIK